VAFAGGRNGSKLRNHRLSALGGQVPMISCHEDLRELMLAISTRSRVSRSPDAEYGPRCGLPPRIALARRAALSSSARSEPEDAGAERGSSTLLSPILPRYRDFFHFGHAHLPLSRCARYDDIDPSGSSGAGSRAGPRSGAEPSSFGRPRVNRRNCRPDEARVRGYGGRCGGKAAGLGREFAHSALPGHATPERPCAGSTATSSGATSR